MKSSDLYMDRRLLGDISINDGALDVIRKPEFHQRTKHTQVGCWKISIGTVNFVSTTHNQLAHVYIKSFLGDAMRQLYVSSYISCYVEVRYNNEYLEYQVGTYLIYQLK